MAKKLTNIEKFVKQMGQLSTLLNSVLIWCPCSRTYTEHEVVIYDKLGKVSAPFHAKIICSVCGKGKYVAPRKKVMILLTTGVFDVLHDGHIALFKELAHRYPEYQLVVGINGDRRACELKDIVVFSAEQRALIVGAIKWVSGVEVFEEDTPSELIMRMKPDIFAKGGDWNDGHVPEADACEEVGAKMIFVGDKVNNSSVLKRKLFYESQ